MLQPLLFYSLDELLSFTLAIMTHSVNESEQDTKVWYIVFNIQNLRNSLIGSKIKRWNFVFPWRGYLNLF